MVVVVGLFVHVVLVSSFQEQDLTKEVPVKSNTIEELKAKLVNKEIGKWNFLCGFLNLMICLIISKTLAYTFLSKDFVQS